MARPKMKFEPAVAVEWIRELDSKIDDYEFCGKVLVKGQSSIHRASDEAKMALAPLVELVEKSHSRKPDFVSFSEEGCEQLRQWLETYVTPAGWQRILAAKRQRKANQKKHHGKWDDRETTVGMLAQQSFELGVLAKQLGIDKKELLRRLPAWFMRDAKGRAAFEAFGNTVFIEQEAQGLKLLGEVFSLHVNDIKPIVHVAFLWDPAKERELYRSAYFAGKPRLTRLSKILKGMPATEQLKMLVTVKHQEKILLELAAAGEMAAVLEALGVPGADDQKLDRVVELN